MSVATLSLLAASFSLLGFHRFGFHVLKQHVQALIVCFPNAPVSFDPYFKLLQWRRPQLVDPPLRVHADVYESGIAQHPQMFRDLRLAKAQRVNYVPHRPRTAPEQFNNLKAIGFGQGSKCVQHVEIEYPSLLYSCQDIFF